MAACNATKEAVWLRSFLQELKEKDDSPMTILIDNQSAVAIDKNLAFYDHSKHNDIQYHFVHEKVKDGATSLEYIPTENQVADVLTKALPCKKYEKFTAGLELL